MIKIQKQQCPNILIENKEQWTEELLDYVRDDSKPPDSIVLRYKNPEIKQAVKEDSFEKCIYCESKVTPTYYGEIEHLKPKKKYPELTFEWSNLGFVCAQCNNKKRDKYDEELPFINPYQENPSEFIIALGAFIYHKSNNRRGEITEKNLELNRSALIEARMERIDSIRNLIDRYNSEENSSLKEALLNEIQTETAKDKPYSMCTSSIIVHLLEET